MLRFYWISIRYSLMYIFLFVYFIYSSVVFGIDRSTQRIEAAAAATGPTFLVEGRSSQILTLFTIVKVALRIATATRSLSPIRDRSSQIPTLTITTTIPRHLNHELIDSIYNLYCLWTFIIFGTECFKGLNVS